jgi:hypothetical protein
MPVEELFVSLGIREEKRIQYLPPTPTHKLLKRLPPFQKQFGALYIAAAAISSEIV